MSQATEATKQRMADEGHKVTVGHLVIEVSTECAALPSDIGAVKLMVPAMTKLWSSYMHVEANSSTEFKAEMNAEFTKIKDPLQALRHCIDQLFWECNGGLATAMCARFDEALEVYDTDPVATKTLFAEMCCESLGLFEAPKVQNQRKGT